MPPVLGRTTKSEGTARNTQNMRTNEFAFVNEEMTATSPPSDGDQSLCHLSYPHVEGKNAGRDNPLSSLSLNSRDVFCFRAFGALSQVELDLFTLSQSAEPVTPRH
jgi:hypothetical protein